MKPVTKELIDSFRKSYDADRQAHILHAALAQTELNDLAFIPEKAAKLQGPFSVEIKTRGITWQQKSGRCWAFAGLNILREIAAERLNLPMFELSGNYITFWDKFEKCSNVLEMAIEAADKPLNDRMMEYILAGIWDGGYFDMFADLIMKYGIVPAAAMPETYQSSHTETFMKVLNKLLKKDICVLRRTISEGKDPYTVKEGMMEEIYRALCIAFGQPADIFDFEYQDADGKVHADYDLTPESFYEKYIGLNLYDYVTVINEPKTMTPLNRNYIFHYFGSMAESDVKFLNLPMEELKELVIRQVKDLEPVWFSCDCRAYIDREKGIWDPDSFDYEGLLGGFDLTLDKTDRMDYRISSLNHAMLITGINFDRNGKPNRYKIENSWGKEVGKDGYYVCSDRYFDEYVYEAVIHRKYLNEAQLSILNKTPIRLNPWEVY